MDHDLTGATDVRSAEFASPEQTGQSGVTSARTRWLTRAAAVFVALIPLTALGIARGLQPDSRGLGTHQQLGLPPCSMRVMLGIRCPGCGMTTSWSYFTRGQMAVSAQTNIAGFLLAWYALAVATVGIRSTLSGIMPSLRTQQALTFAGLAIGGVAIIHWIVRLAL